MGKFAQDHVDYRDSGDGKTVTLLCPIAYTANNGSVYIAPTGFVSDLASVGMARHLIPKWGTHNKAAILHDWLYTSVRVSRRLADKVFGEALKADGVWWWRRKLMYRGVRLFGASHYGFKNYP